MERGKSPVLSIGLIIFALGVVLFGMKLKVDWNGVNATATVTSIRERSETDSTGTKIYYDPFIWYVTQAGDTVKDFMLGGVGIGRYQVGQQIPIVYKLDNVTRFYRAHSFLWYFLFVAIILLGIAVVYLSTKIKSEWK